MDITFNDDNVSLDDDSASEPEYEDYFELNENFTHLTDLIRLQYFAYLKKIINQNISECAKKESEIEQLQISDESIEKCVAHYEERAVRYCMVVQLYRKYMLRTISKIQRETTSRTLLSNLKQCSRGVNTSLENDVAEAQRVCEDEETAGSPKQYSETQQEFCDVETKDKFYEKSSIDHDCFNNNNHHAENGQDNDCYHNEIICGAEIVVSYDDSASYTDNKHENFNDLKSEADDHNTNPHYTDVSYATLSLEEKMHRFEQSIKTCPQERECLRPPRKRKRSGPTHQNHIVQVKLSTSQPLSPVSTSSDDEPAAAQQTARDTVVQDLECLFADEKVANDIDEIFGDCTNSNPAIESILREIENSKIPGFEDEQPKRPRPHSSASTKSSGSRKKRKRYRLQSITCDLRQSLWPCELHMWKRKLNETLSQLADVNLRHYERVRRRFSELFGEDTDDEFAPYSPSVELDDVVIASSMKRIAPIIVKSLMYPMKEGRILNRYLFKRLAKKLAHNIVLCDQYADEDYIKEYVNMFFATGRRVESLLDIDDI